MGRALAVLLLAFPGLARAFEPGNSRFFEVVDRRGSIDPAEAGRGAACVDPVVRSIRAAVADPGFKSFMESPPLKDLGGLFVYLKTYDYLRETRSEGLTHGLEGRRHACHAEEVAVLVNLTYAGSGFETVPVTTRDGVTVEQLKDLFRRFVIPKIR